MSFENQTIIITGAAGDVGRAISQLCYQHGANLVLVDISDTALNKATTGFDPSRFVKVVGDISSEEVNQKMVDVAISRFTRIDGLVANAAIEGEMAPIECITVEDFERVMSINVKGVWLSARAVTPHMKRCSSGSIVITASVGGVTGSPMVSSYVTSKHATVGIMRALSMELGPDNIRVNAVVPCGIEGRMINTIKSMLPEGAIDASVQRQAFKRLAFPIEVAQMMRFLLSDESQMCSGGLYHIDGGYST
jgi:NAD(P)-dependent dehydrogenase (short-subunit alcohol dehydrogenase family)